MTATGYTRSTTSTDSLLRFALRADAVCSGLTGLAGLVLAPRIAQLSGTPVTFEYAMSAFFVVFAIAVWVLASRPAVRTPGLVVAAGNLVFSVATVVLVVADVFPLTTTGIVLTLGTGLYTLVMAEVQYRGVRRI